MDGKIEYPSRVPRYNLTNTQGGQTPNYAAGDQVGDLASWVVLHEAGTRGGITMSVIGWLNSTEAPAIDIWFFNRTTAVSVDNSPAGFPAYACRDHFLGHVEVTANDWSVDSNQGVFSVTKSLPMQWIEEGVPGTIYGAVIARAAFTPTDMMIGIGVLVD